MLLAIRRVEDPSAVAAKRALLRRTPELTSFFFLFFLFVTFHMINEEGKIERQLFSLVSRHF